MTFLPASGLADEAVIDGSDSLHLWRAVTLGYALCSGASVART
jgi:hypothetical protein